MSYKKILIDAQKSGESAIMKFLLQYHEFEKVVACFVEGKDADYYQSRVKDIILDSDNILFYPCNGKMEVEKAKKMIDDNFINSKNNTFMFFCDKDYDLYEKKDDIFYTDYYSVENYYSNQHFVEEIIKNVFHINKYDSDFRICVNLYKERENAFHKEMRKVNAYCYCIRKIEKESNIIRSNINKIKINKFVINNKFEQFEMKKINYTILQEIFETDFEILEEDYNNSIQLIDDTKLRGKWELEFIVWFLEGLKRQIKNGSYNLSKRDRKYISFDNEIMTSMEKYAYTSVSLNYYIKNVFQHK